MRDMSLPEPPAGESSKALLALEKAALFDRFHTPLSTQRKKHFFIKKTAFPKILQRYQFPWREIFGALCNLCLHCSVAVFLTS